jgi:adenine phosphoribosyltransferase
MSDVRELDDLVRRLVRDVPDYPKPGVTFKDITPVLADPDAFARSIEALGAPWRGRMPAVTKVVGIEARGFILAAPVALSLGIGFVPVRKAGKLPAATYAQPYTLEYGEEILEVHQDGFVPGDRVLVVDDVLATGGTIEATARLVRTAGAEVVGVSVLLELTFLGGRDRLKDIEVHPLLSV